MSLDPGAHPAGAGAPSGGRAADLAETMGWIRRSAAAVDQLWGQLRASGSPTLGMALGEASQALHRALMALTNQSSERPGGLVADGPPPEAGGGSGVDSEPAAALSAELAAAVIELAPDGIVVVDSDGAISFANPAAEAIFGHAAGALAGMKVDDLVPDRFRDAHLGHRLGYLDSPSPRPMGVGLELRARRAGGDEVPVQISLSPASVDGRLQTIVVVRDVSAHRASETAARAALLAADEERIAADLHNRIIEGLFLAGIDIQSVMRKTDGYVAGRLAGAVDQIDQVIKEIRATVFDRSPHPE